MKPGFILAFALFWGSGSAFCEHIICKQIDKININTADVATLTHSIKGIGEKRAAAIVAYRELHGKFASLTELAHVQHLGLNFVKHHILELDTTFTVK